MNSKDKILDELLIMKFKEGDSKSLSLFIKRWHSKLIWFSFQTVNDKQEAQDIVQDSWTGIVQGLQNLKEIRSYRSWMYRVIRNKSIDRIRKLQRERAAMENYKLEDTENGEHDNLEEYADTVVSILQTLSGDFKEILQLFYLEQHNVVEISELLSIPKGTVKSRLFRAREQMKMHLQENKY